MADIVKEISNRAEQALNIADQAVIDKDKLAELKHHLEEIKISALYTGKGSSVTKIVTVALVAILTIWGLILLTTGQDLGNFLVLLSPVGMLIGSYGTGKTVQAVAKARNGYTSKVGDMTYKAGDRSRPGQTGEYRPPYTRTDEDVKREIVRKPYSGGGQR